jgi:hypothetical protein
MTESASHVRVIEETSAYWRVLFDNPPFNIVDATIFEGLKDLLARDMQVKDLLRLPQIFLVDILIFSRRKMLQRQ